MLFLLAIVCPPVATLLAGSPRQAIGTAGLTLLLYLPGLFHALTVVDRHYTDRRNEALLRAVEMHYA
jgi:uncharacterized membrane protein YqaE (UPF0057 family)